MDIRDTKALKSFAQERLAQAREEKKIVCYYAGISIGLSVVVVLAQYLLDLRINQSGGLGNMGLRSMLSSVSTLLPILLSAVTMALNAGYLFAMLRIARGQYASPQSLRRGFERFWKLLRLSILKMLIFSGAAIVSVYAATAIFLMTPLSRAALEVLMPLVGQTSVLNPALILDEVLYGELTAAMWPAFVLFGVIFCALAVPLMFRYRLAEYVIIDQPAAGGLAALGTSRRLLRGKFRTFLRLDLSLWWYYAALLLLSLVGYGDQLLAVLGVAAPWSAEVGYYLFYALYEVLQLALLCTLRNRVETCYALAYDSLLPREQPTAGVVLGNIFQQ